MFFRLPPLLVLVLVSGLNALAAAPEVPVGRIVFLGDSITHGGTYVACFDAWMTTRHPAVDREVLNLGLSSETVSGLSEEGHAGGRFPRPDLHERLARVLADTQPLVIFACYGMNCGIYQPFSEERFAEYRKGILRLRKAAAARGAAVIHITPPVYDAARARNPSPGYNSVLGKYADWLLSRRQDGWLVVDLHGPMTGALRAGREKDPDFAFQKDGVHPGKDGHWFIARQLIRFFGDEEAGSAGSPEDMLGELGILPLVEERMKILRDAWLRKTKHQRPGLPEGLPVAEAEEQAAALTARIHEAIKAGPES